MQVRDILDRARSFVPLINLSSTHLSPFHPLRTAGKAGHVEKALEYWQFLKSGKAPVDSKIVMPERPLSERLYIAIINVFAAHKRNEKVDELYRELHALARQVVCMQPHSNRLTAFCKGQARIDRGCKERNLCSGC